ncbi:MAG: PAS domain S-box protein [Candidatus Hermodarchaeota archaeon]
MTTKEIFEMKFIKDVIDASEDTIFVFNPQTGKAILWNKAFRNISGYNDDEIQSLKAPDSYYSSEDLKKAESASNEILEIGKSTLEMRLITKDDRKIPYEYTGTTLQGPDGNMLIVSVGRNVSERKEIERRRRESEEKYRSLFDNMNAGFAYHEVIVDDKNKPIDYKYIEVNPKFEELTGLKKEDLIGKTVTEAIPGTESDPADWIGRFGNVGLTGIPLVVEDYSEAIQKWFKVSGYSPKKGFFAVTFTDITDIKIAEQKLKESEARYRLISENSDMVLWSTDMNLNFTFISQNCSNILGFTPEEVSSTPISARLTPDSLKKVVKVFREELKMEKSKLKQLNRSRRFETEQIHKNGYIIPVEITITFLRDENGEAIGILGVSQNISERKKAEQKLKDSEEKYRKLFDNAPFAILLFNIEGNILDCNNQTYNLTGYSKEELIGNNFKNFNFYVDMALAKLDERQKQVSSGMIPKPREVLLYKKDGNQFWARTHIDFINMRGETFIQAIIHDITEQKQARFKLNESYEKLKELENIINSSPGVVFLWKNSEGWPVEFVSENIIQFGYTQEDFYTRKVIYKEIIHLDDLKRVVEEVNRYSNEDANEFMQEYRIITKSGEIKWLDDRTWMRRDSEGNITHFQGIVLDITNRKKTEEALKLSERNYKDAYDMANFYKDLFTHDMNNILQIINSSAEIISFQLGDSEKSIFIENLTNMIKSQIDRGSKLISDVRTLTSLDEEEIMMNKIDISRFLNESIKFVRKAYPNRKLSISKKNLEESYFIIGNELLQDVFDNILINAVKYNENTIVDLDIRITQLTIDTKKYLQIEFIDNGIGVIDARKELIFQPGHRDIKGTKGMGIGLSLVSKIMEIFNGKIWVEDKVKGDYSQGCKFILLLPEAN